MIFAALILSSLFGCTKAIADDLNVGKIYARAEIVQRFDATVEAEDKKVYVDLHRGWCGNKYCLVGRANANGIEFSSGAKSTYPTVKLADRNKKGIRLGAEYCDASGICKQVTIRETWTSINQPINNLKTTLYPSFVIVAPMDSKDIKITIDYTTSTRETENETW